MYSLLRIPNGHSCWPGIARGKANVTGVWNPRDAKAVRKPAETLLFSFLLPGGQSPCPLPLQGAQGMETVALACPQLSLSLPGPAGSTPCSTLHSCALARMGEMAVKQPQFLPACNEGAGYDFLFSLSFLPSPTHHRFRIHGRLPPPWQRPQGQSLCFLHSGSKQLELSLLG